MSIDWVAPFKFAFELGMFALASLLIVIIVAFFAFVVYAIVKALVNTIQEKPSQRESKTSKKSSAGIITFDKK